MFQVSVIVLDKIMGLTHSQSWPPTLLPLIILFSSFEFIPLLAPQFPYSWCELGKFFVIIVGCSRDGSTRFCQTTSSVCLLCHWPWFRPCHPRCRGPSHSLSLSVFVQFACVLSNFVFCATLACLRKTTLQSTVLMELLLLFWEHFSTIMKIPKQEDKFSVFGFLVLNGVYAQNKNTFLHPHKVTFFDQLIFNFQFLAISCIVVLCSYRISFLIWVGI